MQLGTTLLLLHRMQDYYEIYYKLTTELKSKVPVNMVYFCAYSIICMGL